MRILATGMLCLAVAACDTPNTKLAQFRFAGADVLAGGGGVRIITERSRPQSDGSSRPVICTEPSPDYAVAFGRTAALTANGSGDGITASGSANFGSTELATELAGRTAGVLALRDGLYAACQSYVNGVLGHDAYAMILSQYGDLLVALVGGAAGGKSSSGGGVASTAAPGSVNVSVQSSGGAQPAAAAAGGGQASGNSREDYSATVAALLVACISEHDETRLAPLGRTGPLRNKLLTVQFCRKILDGGLQLARQAALRK